MHSPRPALDTGRVGERGHAHGVPTDPIGWAHAVLLFMADETPPTSEQQPDQLPIEAQGKLVSWKTYVEDLLKPESDDPWDCGHDPSGGDCDYDCPRFANSHAGF